MPTDRCEFWSEPATGLAISRNRAAALLLAGMLYVAFVLAATPGTGSGGEQTSTEMGVAGELESRNDGCVENRKVKGSRWC